MQVFGIVSNIDVFPLSWKVSLWITMEPFLAEHVINLTV